MPGDADLNAEFVAESATAAALAAELTTSVLIQLREGDFGPLDVAMADLCESLRARPGGAPRWGLVNAVAYHLAVLAAAAVLQAESEEPNSLLRAAVLPAVVNMARDVTEALPRQFVPLKATADPG